jgi:hypothetical protein
MARTDRLARRWRRKTPLLAATALALCVVPLAHRLPGTRHITAQQDEAGTSWRASVRMEVLGTAVNGATGKPRADLSRPLAVGEAAAVDLQAGDAEDPSLCNVAFLDPAEVSEPTYHWRLEARVEAAGGAGTTLSLAARRLAGPSSGPSAQAEVMVARKVTLAPGEYHTLDFVAARPGSRDACASLIVRVWADPIPPPGTQVPLDVDVALVHEGRPGSRSVQQRVTGRGGEPVAFRLGPMAWPGGDTHSVASRLQMVVSGTVTASLRADGTLDVTTRAVRTFSWLGNTVGGEGRQDYRSRFGEGAALILPAPRGYFGGGDAAMPAPGAAGDDNTARLDLSRFFEGGETSLQVRIARAAQ